MESKLVTKQSSRNRNLSLDLIKIIAMFGVIALHTFGARDYWQLSNVFYETGVISIPLFFMVSGYLMIGREKVGFYYAFKKIVNIVRFVLILTLVIWALSLLNKSYVINGDIIHKILVDIYNDFVGAFLQVGPLWHCWYLGAIIILYSIMPIINKLFFNFKVLFYIIFISLLILEFWVFIKNLITNGAPFESSITQTFRLWNWFFYFLLGGAIKDLKVKVNNVFLKYAIFITLVINVLFQECLKPILGSPYCEYFYCSFVVMLLVYIIFIYILRLDISSSIVIAVISNLFLPVYILHIFVIKGIYEFMPILTNSVYVMFLAVSIITITISFYLMKIPFMRYVFKL